jgi:hypothetical protein
MFRSFVFLLLADMSVSYAQIRSGAIVGTVSRPDTAKTRATEQIGPPSQSLTGLLFSPIASLRAEQIVGTLSMANCQIGLSAVVFEALIPLPECATSLTRHVP